MPIYEFYCCDCNTLFNFFTPKVETQRRPACPKCSRDKLEKRPARFATLSHGSGTDPTADPDDPFAALDDNAMEQMMGSLGNELQALEESEDPRRLASVLRKVGQASGLQMGPKMEEILGRLEAGEDPQEMDSDLEQAGEDDSMEDYFRLRKKLSTGSRTRPQVDDELYFF